jgi:threonine 3-dehydrogenase
MKALVKSKPEPGVWMQEVPIPEIGVNDVLIKIHKTAICGTDIHIFKWDPWSQKTIKPPLTIGHEFVGTVEKIGSNVHDVELGELVSGEGHIVCGRCRNCLAGRRHLCTGPEDVLITGAGPIGLMTIAVAKHAGARYVVITDINPYRLKLAKKMQPTLVLDAREETIEEAVKKLGMKEGFDVGLEMSGSADAFKSMLAGMCHGGKIALLGIMSPTAIDWDYVVFNSLTIKGIYGREMFETWYKATMLIQKGLDITPVITHHFHYTEYCEAFDVMQSGKSGKVILDWTDK